MSRAAAARRGHEKRRERTEAVTVNLPPDLLPLWERVKAEFSRGTPDERREAFLHYVHEHEAEAIEALAHEADRKVAGLVRAAMAAPPPQPEPVPLPPGPRVYAIGTRKGWTVRVDAPRYYEEDGRTFAYWRGAGAFPVARGTIEDAGGARVRAVPGDVARELDRLQDAIAALQSEREALLRTATEDAPPVRVGEVPF